MEGIGPAERRSARGIAAEIRDGIAAGRLAVGSPLPSTRALAAEWGASRTTVTAAFEQLASEGYVETRPGARARVARGVGAPPPADHATAPPRLSRYARAVADLAPPAVEGSPPLADFRYGDVAAADFPALAWRRTVSRAALRRPPRLRYGDPRGSTALRAALQGYLWRARGLRCDPGEIVVVNGSQQGLDLCARLLLDPGDRVLVEEPGYAMARQIFAAAGAAVVPAAVDGDGLRTAALPPARLAYVTPSHQYPLGGVMPAARRRELLGWARRVGAHVIEDDYDAEFRYGADPVPALRALDGAGSTIYLGTLSKTLSPALRLGYAVVPAGLAALFAAAKGLADRGSPALEQEALAAFIAEGGYERHVRRVRRRNGQRRARLLSCLSAALGRGVRVVGAEAGLHVVAWLDGVPAGREGELVARARAAGLGLYPVGPLYRPGAARPEMAGLVMGYASLDEAAIGRGVEALARVVAAMR